MANKNKKVVHSNRKLNPAHSVRPAHSIRRVNPDYVLMGTKDPNCFPIETKDIVDRPLLNIAEELDVDGAFSENEMKLHEELIDYEGLSKKINFFDKTKKDSVLNELKEFTISLINAGMFKEASKSSEFADWIKNINYSD